MSREEISVRSVVLGTPTIPREAPLVESSSDKHFTINKSPLENKLVEEMESLMDDAIQIFKGILKMTLMWRAAWNLLIGTFRNINRFLFCHLAEKASR